MCRFTHVIYLTLLVTITNNAVPNIFTWPSGIPSNLTMEYIVTDMSTASYDLDVSNVKCTDLGKSHPDCCILCEGWGDRLEGDAGVGNFF
jgi:hypothetical protein